MKINTHKIKKNSIVILSTKRSGGEPYCKEIKKCMHKLMEESNRDFPVFIMVGSEEEDRFDILEFEELTKEEIKDLIKEYKDHADLPI